MLFEQKSIEQFLTEDPTGRSLYRYCVERVTDIGTPFPFPDELDNDLDDFFVAIQGLVEAHSQQITFRAHCPTRAESENQSYDYYPMTDNLLQRLTYPDWPDVSHILYSPGLENPRLNQFVALTLYHGRGFLFQDGGSKFYVYEEEGVNKGKIAFEVQWLRMEQNGPCIVEGPIEDFIEDLHHDRVLIDMATALSSCQAKREMQNDQDKWRTEILCEALEKAQLLKMQKERMSLMLTYFISYRSPEAQPKLPNLPRDVHEVIKGYLLK